MLYRQNDMLIRAAQICPESIVLAAGYRDIDEVVAAQ